MVIHILNIIFTFNIVLHVLFAYYQNKDTNLKCFTTNILYILYINAKTDDSFNHI